MVMRGGDMECRMYGTRVDESEVDFPEQGTRRLWSLSAGVWGTWGLRCVDIEYIECEVICT